MHLRITDWEKSSCRACTGKRISGDCSEYFVINWSMPRATSKLSSEKTAIFIYNLGALRLEALKTTGLLTILLRTKTIKAVAGTETMKVFSKE